MIAHTNVAWSELLGTPILFQLVNNVPNIPVNFNLRGGIWSRVSRELRNLGKSDSPTTALPRTPGFGCCNSDRVEQIAQHSYTTMCSACRQSAETASDQIDHELIMYICFVPSFREMDVMKSALDTVPYFFPV